MAQAPTLHWLPSADTWQEKLNEAKDRGPKSWPQLVELSRYSLNLIQTERLARMAYKTLEGRSPEGLAVPVIRLAVIGSSTLAHLIPSIRVAMMRRNMWADIFTGEYGQYLQELSSPESALRQFAPDTVLLALDARHLVGAASAMTDAAKAQLEKTLDRVAHTWTLAKDMGAHLIQQTVMPVFPALAGSNEHRVPWSSRTLVNDLNASLKQRADSASVDILSLEQVIERDGLPAWYSSALWHRAKQEVHPGAAPYYGDLVARILAARAGRSAKCLVLDLDNTLWGGVIGDDGMHGIALGQGSPVGEAHVALQAYAKDLTKRGIILAVCSKNDEANALEPFESHPDMILRKDDIACFVANWDDKATNLRRIAQTLNIGLDALVFVDDNPFERNIIRRELPMVSVPEIGEDPSDYVEIVADSGCFEAVVLTTDDELRAKQYQANIQREAAKSAVTDMTGYLESLDMKLIWSPFDQVGNARIVQLINKSNQFNLTTRRYSALDVEALMGRSDVIHLQLRLQDAFGDNGMISVVICRVLDATTAEIDTWLMSCRVLGRGVEEAALNILVDCARALGVTRLVGRYIPTPKNSMVSEHYRKLGFALVDEAFDGATEWALDLEAYTKKSVYMDIVRV
jgi:FkbH-like protein